MLIPIPRAELYLGFFCLWGQILHTFTGVSSIWFFFTPTLKASSKIFKKANDTDAFCFKL